MSDDFRKYNASAFGLIGLQTEFKLCHIPFLVWEDVLGALALQGSSGTGKTTIVKKLGRLNELATGGRFGVFSADKARYEDFVGCPIPDQQSGLMKMYPMPNSVAQMEVILVDEINRANYENQEKWLSLIATRLIDSIPVKTRYIFTAMNPVLSDTSDTYEGVQPLDKALGERMLGLVDFPSFGKLSSEDRVKVLESSVNQVRWEPTDEQVELHKAYLIRARELYSELKVKGLSSVAAYVDAVQEILRKETKGAISVEARRAQYIVTNILATHALDKVFNPAIQLTQSAESALLMSFPNPLWEQEVLPTALKAAHTRSVSLLRLTTNKTKSVSNMEGLSKPTAEILDLAHQKVPREQISKAINMLIPDEKDDPINHYCYAVGAALGLKIDQSGKLRQNVMKEQEFSRLEKVYEKLVASPGYTKWKKAGEYAKAHDHKFESKTKLPSYIATDEDPDAVEMFVDLCGMDWGLAAVAIAELPEVELFNGAEVLTVLEKITETVRSFKEVKDIYSNLKK